MYLLETTNEDLKLAKAEICALSNSKVISYKNIFLANCNYERLTLLNNAYIILKEFPKCSSFKFIEVNVKKETAFKFVKILKDKGAKVNLDNPEKIFAIIKFKNKNYLCEKIFTNKKEFLLRHPKKRPEFHPGACMPKFSKELVNLSGIKEHENLLDPFCGTGGMLIEAGFMNINITGYDISNFMLNKAKKNLEYYNLHAELRIQDALKINKQFDAIVTELPFGKTTILDRKVSTLFKDFLDNITKNNITKKVVVGLPDNNRYSTKGWKKTFDHKIYIHKSLSKRILVLEKIT